MKIALIFTILLNSYLFCEELVKVQGGEFIMGDHLDYSAFVEKTKKHKVYVSDFYISRYQVTVKEWLEFINSTNYSYDTEKMKMLCGDENCPASYISWYDAVFYCNWRSKKEGINPCYEINKTFLGKLFNKERYKIKCNFDSNGYRLPTEAEWEYAARGGHKSKGYIYSGSDSLYEVAMPDKEIYPVGQKKPNELGIFDMSGNVKDWCWDEYEYDYYSKSPYKNPKGPNIKRGMKVIRGGNEREMSMVFYRSHAMEYSRYYLTGIRVVRSKIDKK